MTGMVFYIAEATQGGKLDVVLRGRIRANLGKQSGV